MAVVKMAQVPEALVEVTVHSSAGPFLPVGRRQRALGKNAMQKNFSSVASLGTFPAQGFELLSRLDRGEDAWIPDLQSSDESADEGPVKPTMKRWPKAGMWWDLYRSPATYPSTSESSEDEQESEDEEEKLPRGSHKLTILRRSVLDIFKGNGLQSMKQMEASKSRPQLKKRAFKTKASLLSHQKTHSRERPYECSFCGERFTAKKVLASHQRGHAEERGYKHLSSGKCTKAYLSKNPFKCPECEKCFQRKDTLAAHLNSHTAERPYRCLECEATFTRKQNLKRHQKLHKKKAKRPPKGEREARAAISPGAPEKKPPAVSASEGTLFLGLGADREQETTPNLFKCQFCGRCMRSKSLLADHERIHREERSYKCSQCQKSFLHKYRFLQHEATHQRKAASQRPVRMSAKYTPSASRIIRTVENPSAVPTDGKKVSNVRKLSQSPRSPGRERVYKCRYCGKCLSGSGPLTNHEKLHRRRRSYKCPDCVKCFSRKDDLLRHKATHKKLKPVGRPRLKSSRSERIHTEPEPHTAQRDGVVTRSVARSLSLSKHLKAHMEGKAYKCQYCGEHARTKRLLANHERIHRRKKKPFQCLECGKSFSQKNYLACHERGHMRKKLSKLSGADKKMTTSNHRSLKRENPHRSKAPWLCYKCGKCFDCRSSFTRHQMTHLAEKPFKCVCGKTFIQMWHLKRHKKTKLNKKCYKKLIWAKGKCAMLNSANGVHPEEKNWGEPRVHSEPPTALSTDTEEENICSLAALEEAPEVEILDFSEQGGTHVQVQVELSEQSQQNSLQNCRQGNVSVSQPVESERKLSGKDHVNLRCKQDDPSKDQQAHPRHCSKRVRHWGQKKKKASVKWKLRSQAVMLRRRSKQKMPLVGEQARSCFCQQEGPEVMPRRKPSLLQHCKKVKTSIGPKTNLHSLFKSAPNCCIPEEQDFCPPYQNMLSAESQPETAKSAALETTGICDAVSIGEQEDLQELPWLPERSPLQVFETAEATNEHQNASLQNIELMPRWTPSSLEASKEVVTCSSPPRSQHTAASSGLLRGSPKGCEPGELCFCLSPQTMFSTNSKLEIVETAALEMLATAALQKEPEEGLGRDARDSSDSGSCMEGKCSAVAIGGQEDLQELPPAPERSPLQSCEGAQAAKELQDAQQQPKLQQAPLGEAGKTSLQKERGNAEPQTAMAAEPQSPAAQDEDIPGEEKSEETERYRCSHCAQFFESRASLEKHEKRHLSRPFLCMQCEKGFFSVTALNTHMRIHTGEKPYKCPECDFCCNVSSNLSRHRKTHIRKSTHICPLCRKSFLFSHSLAMHWQMHSEKEVYTCADCGQMFLYKNLLNLHRRHKHWSEAMELG